MLVKINFKNLIAAIAALIVCIMMLNGSLQSVVHFAGALNELAFTFLAFMMMVVFLAMSFEKPKKCS